MLKGQPTLLVDQYGQHVYARTLKELHEQVPGRINRMFHDAPDGRVLHIGYVVGQRWFRAYRPVEREVCI